MNTKKPKPIKIFTEEVNKTKQHTAKTTAAPTKTITRKNLIKLFQEEEKETIHIYDAGHNTTQQILPITNHINKTGTNPLREHQVKPIKFYDITNLYSYKGTGLIAECFGNNAPTKRTNQNYISCHFLCHYIIIAHLAGFKKIYGYVID